jgi:hypothetical protein
MTAEVIAIEVKQFVGPEGLRTLVPRVIGQTAAAETRKGSRQKRQWDEASFLSELEAKRGPGEAQVARDLLEWARVQKLRIFWGSGKVDGSFQPVLDDGAQAYYPFGVWTNGRMKIQFQYLMQQPPFADVELRHELRRRLNDIPSISIPEDAVTRLPGIPLALFAADPEALKALKGVLDWFCDTVKSQRGG